MVSKKNEEFQCTEYNTYNHSKFAFQGKNKKFFARLRLHNEQCCRGAAFFFAFSVPG
jgi:hypothetical protein